MIETTAEIEVVPTLHRLSASKRGLAKSCLYWARPDVAIPEGSSSEAADLGSALHEDASLDVDGDAEDDGVDVFDQLLQSRETHEELVAKWGLSDAQATALEALRASWSDWWIHEGKAHPWGSEVPFAFDATTGRSRRLPKEAEVRAYKKHCTPTEIPGTVDLYYVEQATNTAYILDIKTGRPPKRTKDYIEQLEHNAVCVAGVYGATSVVVGILHIMPDRVEASSTVTLDEWDLEIAAAAMRAEVAAIHSAEPRPGLHCREKFCSALAVCPVTVAIVEDAAAEIVPARRRLPLVGELAENDDAAWMHVATGLLEAWLKDRKKAVRAYVDAHGAVAFEDGSQLVKSEEQRQTPRLDVPGAMDALRSVLGEDAESAVEKKTSRAAIERVCRVIAPPRGLGAMVTRTMDALRDAHAMKVSIVPKYSVRKPKKGTE